MTTDVASSPPDTYLQLQQAGQVRRVRGMNGPGVLVSRRAETDQIARQPDVYSDRAGIAELAAKAADYDAWLNATASSFG